MSKEIEETIKRINEKVKKMDKGHNFFIDYEQEHKDLKLILNYIENSIPKEKIEEKIKELDEEILNTDELDSYTLGPLIEKKDVLEELLEGK